MEHENVPAKEEPASSAHGHVSVADRLLAVLLYLGLAPFLRILPSRFKQPFLAHHARHALAIFFLLFVIICLFATVILVLSYALVHQRTVYENLHLDRLLFRNSRRLFLCWGVVWLFAVLLALLGSKRPVLLVSRIARRETLLKMAASILLLAYGAGLAATPFVAHAALLVKGPGAPGDVYMIYEDVDKFPRWLFECGFYRIALEATHRWGPGSARALELSPEAIAEAKRNGRFIFIGSHGRARGILCDGNWIEPRQVEEMPSGNRLEFVYLTSCDSGVQREEWEKAFAPAKVVTFDRLSAIVEHIWWLWTDGPDVVRKLGV